MKIITRNEAIEKGQNWYFTGRPCKHGHIAKRDVINANCSKCRKIRTKEYQQKNRKAINVNLQNYDRFNKLKSESGTDTGSFFKTLLDLYNKIKKR